MAALERDYEKVLGNVRYPRTGLQHVPLTGFEQVVILERDHATPQRVAGADSAEGSDYLAAAQSRRGVPQFVQIHVFLSKGWELAQGLLPGLEAAALSAGVVKSNMVAEVKEVYIHVLGFGGSSNPLERTQHRRRISSRAI